jgi:type I restriction enzyme, S subunit
MIYIKQHPPLTDPDLASYDLTNKRYIAADCVVICRVKEPFGHLLNMSSEYPLIINGLKINSVEALYQALRFPLHPGLQRLIIEDPSPLMAKDSAKVGKDRGWGRTDWYQKKVKIMRWCLQIKLACHYDEVGFLLDSTGDKDIVETSPDGNFWGGLRDDDSYFGANVFGQLLMELRGEYRTKSEAEMRNVQMLAIENFLLYGDPIQKINRIVNVAMKKKMDKNPEQLDFGL